MSSWQSTFHHAPRNTSPDNTEASMDDYVFPYVNSSSAQHILTNKLCKLLKYAFQNTRVLYSECALHDLRDEAHFSTLARQRELQVWKFFESATETPIPICAPWTLRLRSLVNENRKSPPILCKTCSIVTFLYTPTRNFSTHGYPRRSTLPSVPGRRRPNHGVCCAS